MTLPARRHSLARRALFGLAVLALALPLAGCGCGSCEEVVVDDFYGNVFVDNWTDTTTVEYVIFFQVAVVGGPWTGDLLVDDVPPGGTQFVGTFGEDVYDAYAELEFGDWVDWFDVFVGYGEDVFFEVY
jgi:hypothetical protein